MAFGNSVISFTMEQYQNFCEYILQFYPNYNKTCFKRNIWIPTTDSATCLLLSGKELHDLQEMLKKSQSSLELIKLLEGIHKQQN